MDPYAYWSLIFLVAGLTFLIMEVFLPSAGLLATLTILSLFSSIALAAMAWWAKSPTLFWAYCAMILLLIPGTLAVAFYWLPFTPAGRRILLEPPDERNLNPLADQESHLQRWVGERGRAATDLLPSGFVTVGGSRHEAVTTGLPLKQGTEILVTGVRESRLVVGAAPAVEAVAEVRDVSRPQPIDKPPLDFDFPEG